jgi:hypothetical protein
VDPAKLIETTIAGSLKPRGYRKRERNWFRTTSANEYQVVNVQKSSWGGGDCYLNLGWDASLPSGEFRPFNHCAINLRAENTDVITPIHHIRPDGVTEIELPGISLLDSEISSVMPEDDFTADLLDVVVTPVADLMDRTPSIVDLVPLLTAKPWFASLRLRSELRQRGHELPTSWRAGGRTHQVTESY